jgi:hypothetical protein
MTEMNSLPERVGLELAPSRRRDEELFCNSGRL